METIDVGTAVVASQLVKNLQEIIINEGNCPIGIILTDGSGVNIGGIGIGDARQDDGSAIKTILIEAGGGFKNVE